MDWNHEVLDSIIWLGKAFVISLIGLTLITAILTRFTGWGQQFKRIAWPYFTPKRSKIPFAVLALIILFTLSSVRLNVLFSFWYNGFYSAMQKLDAKAFWFMLIIFGILASIHVTRTLLNFYLRQSFLIHWRVWLTNTLIDRWLGKQAYYRGQYIASNADNPDQRIQQDVDTFVTSSLTLSMGLLDAVVSLFEFTIILWGLSGILAIFGIEIPRAMVFLVYLYVLLATVFAVWVGRPLIQLNFLNEKLNANFRYALIRVKEYGESIAFYRGEKVEHQQLSSRFDQVIGNVWGIVFRSLKFQGFNLSISQMAVVFPFIVQAPRLLSKQITLGDMMQTSQSFGQVQEALSFFRTSYDDFAVYRAVLNRLSGFLDAMDEIEALPNAQIKPTAHEFSISALSVTAPDQRPLIKDLNMSLPLASAMIIRGPSGSGKTTLLRAIAGLWPYTQGTVNRPVAEKTLFLPQKPYLPLGTLRSALYYPNHPDAGDHAANILEKCQLAHLINRLDEEAEWASILSLGEQQRLAIGRAILSHPNVLFLDESSSAMDEGLEHAMYTLLKNTLSNTIIISVGHRSTLLSFHDQELALLGNGQWQINPLHPK